MNTDHDVVEPLLKANRKINKIWVLPIVAALIGAGMVYNEWRNRGVEIQISFETADGLAVGKTSVRYRNVEIGTVNYVGFTDQHESIIAKVEIDKSMKTLLKPDSQFWVVRPRVGAGGISGLGTLLTGGYIELSPGISDGLRTDFIGLESPPVTPANADGLHLTLRSQGGKPLSIGSSVTYRGFKVGVIESLNFDIEERVAFYDIFIRSPYDALVTSNTIFWNSSGLSVTANAEGVKLSLASLESLVEGGVEFDVPSEKSLGQRISSNQTFALYDSPEGVEENRQYEYFEYLVLVEDSVGGLYAGAPVEYLGIRVGTVTQPYLALDTKLDGVEDLQADPRIPVLVRIEPGRVFDDEGADLKSFIAELEDGMLKGLAASIESANMLTGSLKVSLRFGAEPISKLEKYGQYSVIPSKRGGIKAITQQVQDLLDSLNSLPLNETVARTNRAIKTADNLLKTVEVSMVELQTTLKGVQPNSSAYQALSQTLDEMGGALETLQPLINDLREHPNSLIFGKEAILDSEPKASPEGGSE